MPRIRLLKTPGFLFVDTYSHSGVQRFIQWILDSQGIGQFELSKRSGLNPATIYQILTKPESSVSRPPRRSTLTLLAKAVGADVRFDHKKNLFSLTRQHQIPQTELKELDILLTEIASAVLKRGKPLTRTDREMMVRVVKAVV